MAEIYTMVGEYEDAIDKIEYLLTIPAPISKSSIKHDPIYQPLREYPRFKRLLEEK